MDSRAEILSRWERAGKITQKELDELKALSTEEEYKRLLPFLKRDLSGKPCLEAEELKDLEKDRLAESIMDEIDSGRKKKPVFYFLTGAAASAAIFFLLLLALNFFHPSNGTGIDDMNMVVLRFELSAPEAESVFLVGDFNEWDPGSHKMKNVDGVWQIEMKLQPDKTYTYNFLIDGEEWISDPLAESHIDDPFGGEKSVLNL
jgi:hypothetical protein